MTPKDVPFGMSLKEAAGWNQLDADWHRLVVLEPDGCFLAEFDGQPAGTVVACRFDDIGWIAMMLVNASRRRIGIGRALMLAAIDWLESLQVVSIRLDATPLGEPLYDSLGFRTDATVFRYSGISRGAPARGSVQPLRSDRLDEIADLDRLATGTNRRRLLERWASEDPHAFQIHVESGRPLGYLWSRPGSRARQIGPCVAITEDAGHRLLADALNTWVNHELFIDIPEVHSSARALAERAGLSVARRLTRMTRGPKVAERLDRIWASSGPELG
jgi:GNAT superfamily N-acetyltransferase